MQAHGDTPGGGCREHGVMCERAQERLCLGVRVLGAEVCRWVL